MTDRVSRRKWLKYVLGTSLLGASGVGLYTWRIEPHWVEVVRRPMAISNLPSSLQGRKLVQISDIHIGELVDEQYLISCFQRVAEWKPDIVVFTGDFLTLNHDGSLPVEKMERVLEQFPHGSLGTIGILGNHDYGLLWGDAKAAQTVTAIAQNAGIDLLRNRTRDLSGLQVIGFDDYWGTNFQGAKVLRDVDLNLPSLVLCHNPDIVDLPIWNGYQGWILSGHTHGGQCKAPFLTPPQLPIHNKRYAAGEIDLLDGRRLYVNRALGYSMRVRFNVRPEITVFTLEKTV